MSITSRINEMSSHIEQAYDELQGLGADLTNVNKNIENISMVLDDIYDSMPQVSGEGTSLTLDDTRVGKIKSTLKGNASQTGTPTPSSPIPVNVVSGDNEINVCGKNLLKLKNGSNVSQGVTITINDNKATFVGTPTRAYVGSVDMPLNLKKGTYTLSSTNGVNSFFLWFKNQSGNVFSSVAIRPNPSTITLNEDTYSIQVGLEGLTVGTACNVETYFQLEKGSSATTYEAYQGNTYNIDLPVENLFDKDNVVASTGLTSEGGTFSSNNYCITGYIKVGGNISMNIHNEVNNKTKRVCYYTSQTESSFINVSEIPNNKVLSFTTPSNCQYIRLQVEQSDKDNTMLEYGSKQNSFTPYGTTPIELCKIGNYQDYFGKSDGRNLFDKSTITTSAYLKEDGTLQTGTGAEYITSDFIPVTPNTTYYKTLTLSPRTKFYDKNKQVLDNSTYQDISIGGNAGSFTTPNNAYYFRFTGNVNTSTGININTTMVNEGSSALPYEPYGVGKWYLHKEIGKVVLNGSESSLSRGGTGITGYYRWRVVLDNPLLATSTTIIVPLLCNRLANVTVANTYGGREGFAIDVAGNYAFFYIDETKTYSLNDMKVWLASNNLVVYYILATPTTTEVEYQPLIDQLNELEKAQSKDNQTNISQVNNDLPFIISASALKEWQESTSLNSTLSMANPLSLGNTLNTQEIDNNTQPIEVDNIEPLEEEENEES